MKTLNRTFIFSLCAISLSAAAWGQTVVVGTGNPDADVAAVQDAVDAGGSILLQGRFSFQRPPSQHGYLPELKATILVTKEVHIFGEWNDRGQVTEIDGGEIPFAVEAPGAVVTIEELRFVRPRLFAIFVDAAAGLTIESTTVDGVDPELNPISAETGLTFAFGIYVSPMIGRPSRERPGDPSRITGTLAIRNNQITIGGAPSDGIGIVVQNAGRSETPVEVDISGNTIRDGNLKGITAVQINGRARIERNTVTTSALAAPQGPSAAIHVGGTGSYMISNNVVEVRNTESAGIRLRGYPPLGTEIAGAVVTGNDVTLSASDADSFGEGNAGIEVMGMARENRVEQNRIRGRGKVGMSISSDKQGEPVGNIIEQNDSRAFVASPPAGDRQK